MSSYSPHRIATAELSVDFRQVCALESADDVERERRGARARGRANDGATDGEGGGRVDLERNTRWRVLVAGQGVIMAVAVKGEAGTAGGEKRRRRWWGEAREGRAGTEA